MQAFSSQRRRKGPWPTALEVLEETDFDEFLDSTKPAILKCGMFPEKERAKKEPLLVAKPVMPAALKRGWRRAKNPKEGTFYFIYVNFHRLQGNQGTDSIFQHTLFFNLHVFAQLHLALTSQKIKLQLGSGFLPFIASKKV